MTTLKGNVVLFGHRRQSRVSGPVDRTGYACVWKVCKPKQPRRRKKKKEENLRMFGFMEFSEDSRHGCPHRVLPPKETQDVTNAILAVLLCKPPFGLRQE